MGMLISERFVDELIEGHLYSEIMSTATYQKCAEIDSYTI